MGSASGPRSIDLPAPPRAIVRPSAPENAQCSRAFAELRRSAITNGRRPAFVRSWAQVIYRTRRPCSQGAMPSL
jgi:hypothetical protein